MNSLSESFQNLYAHFPFCETKCHYCDFFSLPESSPLYSERGDIYKSICTELDLYSIGTIDTLFLGGGTPSLVQPEYLTQFMSKLRLTSQSECTMEVNPSSVSGEKAKTWRALGINRVSMGVQALNDERLKWLGRVHSKSAAHLALDALFCAGFERVSIDYIVGVPNQSVEDIRKEIGEILNTFPKIEHLSVYLLTLKNSNPKSFELPNEEIQLEHLETVDRTLSELGFEHYEISNFARPGTEALHNLNYWAGGSYLGIGPSAHSHSSLLGKRWKNWASLGKYRELVSTKQHPVEWTEDLTAEQKSIEKILLGLRTKFGILLDSISREKLPKLAQFSNQGLVQITDTNVRLTSKGMFLSDEIIANLV